MVEDDGEPVNEEELICEHRYIGYRNPKNGRLELLGALLEYRTLRMIIWYRHNGSLDYNYEALPGWMESSS
jgi:hypothetical protein